jgi:hypothetical protein
MKYAAAIFFAGLMAAPHVFGQKLEIKLDAIAAKASAKNEVDLDGPLLKIALEKAVQKKEGKEAKDGKDSKAPLPPALLAGVKGVYVRNYEFEKPGAYSDAELEPLRKQVGDGSGWARIVRLKEKNESTEIFLLSHGEEVAGALVLVAEPKELTVVHIVGSMTLAQMKEMVNSNIHYDLGALMAQSAK